MSVKVWVVVLMLGGAAAGAVPREVLAPEALRLRDVAIAALENEQPLEAETALRELLALVPADPLPLANLAIALLRQQRAAEAAPLVARALELAPGRADLLALQAEVELWSGDASAATATFLRAAKAAGDDPETWYAVLRASQAMGSGEGDAAGDEALEALSRLRPENAVVLLSRLRRAIERGDRPVASAAVLRLGELAWQFPQAGAKTLAEVRAALEGGELAAARVPAIRLENVTKILPLYQQSLLELNTGILGLPVWRFIDEPSPSEFGGPVPISFVARPLVAGDAAPAADAGTIAWGFFDDDDLPDFARLAGSRLEIRRSSNQWKAEAGPRVPPRAGRLLAVDLDDDAHIDVLTFSPSAASFAKGDGRGGFVDASESLGFARIAAVAAAVFDVDVEGDLDLAVLGPRRPGLWLNTLAGPLQDVGAAVFGGDTNMLQPRALVATDLDRDGDVDLVALDSRGVVWFENLRQGQVRGRRLWSGSDWRDLASADLDGDGQPELVVAGDSGVVVLRRHGRGENLTLEPVTSPTADFSPAPGTAIVVLDADNDGRLDLAVAGPAGVEVWVNRGSGSLLRLEPAPVEGSPRDVRGLVAVDLDRDGDLDLVVSSPAGVGRLDNRGGNRNRWLAVQLRGIDRGSGKNNRFGLGATIEVRSGSAFQWREVTSQQTHFGLGSTPRAEVVRVEWTNGVPQNRLAVSGRQVVVEEQVLKGSCPFLYAWDGERMSFVTDLLWGAPIGLPYAPGKWIPADPSELVKIPQIQPRDGRYQLRITEELWEAAFIDHTRLWIVDHPGDVEVASALRMGVGLTPERVLASRNLRPLAGAWDGRGIDVTDRVAARDEVYADGFEASHYQGVAAREWSLVMDLGEAPRVPVRLHLDAWIFPADASLNLAVAQRDDLSQVPPRLEVEVDRSWVPVAVDFGFPAGKTKTMVVDLPSLPAGASRLRLVTSMWLGFDRIAWTTEPVDDEVELVAQLLPTSADLDFRGFSRLVRAAPNAPHSYDYQSVSTESPWLPFPGRYTRFGDVRELLESPDSRSVVLAAGDEIALEFDVSDLPAPLAGWSRSVFLETWGWDKDADRNTFEAEQVEPLPFLEMERYGDPLPARLEPWRDSWLTREVPDEGRGER